MFTIEIQKNDLGNWCILFPDIKLELNILLSKNVTSNLCYIDIFFRTISNNKNTKVVSYNSSAESLLYQISAPGEYEIKSVSCFCFEVRNNDYSVYVGKINTILLKFHSFCLFFSTTHDLKDTIVNNFIDHVFLVIDQINIKYLSEYFENFKSFSIITDIPDIVSYLQKYEKFSNPDNINLLRTKSIKIKTDNILSSYHYNTNLNEHVNKQLVYALA
ncbi:MAG: hypothetical protein NZZ41_04570 [Candidatus Dojkabacteria bacterium]|nr:hypothetical protein [Candidatus Dojkabacteria bacterium]